jgi:hypothetical protein
VWPDPHEYWTASVFRPGFESLGPFNSSTEHPDIVFIDNGISYFEDKNMAKNVALLEGNH